MAKINELNIGQGNVEVEGILKEFGEPRTFNKFGRELTVVNVDLEDDSGTIKLSLWNEDASRFKAGDKIKIINGYVSEFQGEPQLTSGKFGSIEKLDTESSEATSAESEESSASEEKITVEDVPTEPEEEPETHKESEEEHIDEEVI